MSVQCFHICTPTRDGLAVLCGTPAAGAWIHPDWARAMDWDMVCLKCARIAQLQQFGSERLIRDHPRPRRTKRKSSRSCTVPLILKTIAELRHEQETIQCVITILERVAAVQNKQAAV
jgi:hypothetical protein